MRQRSTVISKLSFNNATHSKLMQLPVSAVINCFGFNYSAYQGTLFLQTAHQSNGRVEQPQNLQRKYVVHHPPASLLSKLVISTTPHLYDGLFATWQGMLQVTPRAHSQNKFWCLFLQRFLAHVSGHYFLCTGKKKKVFYMRELGCFLELWQLMNVGEWENNTELNYIRCYLKDRAVHTSLQFRSIENIAAITYEFV